MISTATRMRLFISISLFIHRASRSHSLDRRRNRVSPVSRVRALLDAGRRGDVDAAIDLLRSHLDNAMHSVIGFLRSAGQRA